MVSDADFASLKSDFETAKKELARITDLLFFVKGRPVIQGYAAKKFDLNDNLNVVLLLKRLKDVETILGISTSKSIVSQIITTVGEHYRFTEIGNRVVLEYSATGEAPWTDTGTSLP